MPDIPPELPYKDGETFEEHFDREYREAGFIPMSKLFRSHNTEIAGIDTFVERKAKPEEDKNQELPFI